MLKRIYQGSLNYLEKIIADKDFSINFIVIIISTYLCFPVFSEPNNGFDSSWMLGLNYCISHDYIFGKDIIYTYGPLGFLQTRLPYQINRIWFFVFDFSLIILFSKIVLDIFKKLPIKKTLGVGLIGAICISAGEPDIQIPYFLFFIFIYYLCSDKWPNYILAAFICVFSFYIKLNTGIAFLLLFVISIGYKFMMKQIELKALLTVASVFVIIFWLSTYLFNLDILSYIKNSLTVINFYNDAVWLDMRREGNYHFIHLLIIIYIGTVAMIISLWKKEKRNPTFYLLIFLTISYLFILFKSSFVRADNAHVSGFFRYYCLPILLFPAIIKSFSAKHIYLGILPVVITSLVFTGMHKFGFNFTKTQKIAEYISILRGGDAYIEQTQSYLSKYSDVKLDSTIIEKIAGESVDIFPFDISKLIFNKLNYKPRPNLQAFLVYSTYLDSLNANSLLSPFAPKFLFYKVFALDDRYSFFDESVAWLSIMKNYSAMQIVNNEIVMRKNEFKKQLSLEHFKTTKCKLNQDIELDTSQFAIYGRIKIEYSTWGKIQRFLFQPPKLYITFTFEDGNSITHRAIVTELNTLVLLNRYIDNTGDALAFLKTGGSLNKKVSKVQISTSESNGFKTEFTLELSKLNFNSTKISKYEPDNLEFHITNRNLIDNAINVPNNSFLTESIKSDANYVYINSVNFLDSPYGVLGVKKFDVYHLIKSEASVKPLIIPAYSCDFSNIYNGSSDIKSPLLGSRKLYSLIAKKDLPKGDFSLSYLVIHKQTEKSTIYFNTQKYKM